MYQVERFANGKALNRTYREGFPVLRRLRIKFVAVFMALVMALLTVVVYAGFLSARQDMERISLEILRRAMQEERGKATPEPGLGEVVLPYFTVDIWGGTAYVTGGTYNELENTETLSAILSDCLSEEEQEGTLPAYSLRYLRKNNGWHTRIAFVDISMEIVTIRQMVASYLLIAALSLLPLFGVSILLSRWAAAPVEKALRQQRQFLSDASHELKTPLTVILSNAELLEGAELAERPRRWAENIRSESRRMKTLVEEMLTLARAGDALPSAVPEEVPLSDIAADCALAFEAVAFEAGKPLQYELDADITLLGNGERLRKLISVLLDNAIKYGADGGIIRMTLMKTERSAVLTVSNPGEMIPPETLPRLFERFYRADSSRGEQSGFGLGLSIASAIAKEHRGVLRAESDSDSTRFTFTAPLKR